MATIISNGAYKGIDEVDVSEKRVLVRADLNVPIAAGQVSDATRIERLIPTLEALAERKAKIVVLSHLGRPKGETRPEFSLRLVAEKLSAMMKGKTIGFVDDCIGSKARSAVAALQPGEIIVLENLRFHPGEEKMTPILSQNWLASGISSLTMLFPYRTAPTHRFTALRVGCRLTPGRKCLPSSRHSGLFLNCRGGRSPRLSAALKFRQRSRCSPI